MKLARSAQLSGRHLRAHSVRATLTTLGVVIGVAAVVVFLSLGTGLQAAIVTTVTGDNPSGMYVSVRPSGVTGPRVLGHGGPAVFTAHDVASLAALDGVDGVLPYESAGSRSVVHDGQRIDRVHVDATVPGYFDAQGRQFVAGGPFTGPGEVVLNAPAAAAFDRPVGVGDRVTIDPDGRPINATVVGIVQPPPSLTAQFAGGSTPPAGYVSLDDVAGPTVASPATGETEPVYPWLIVEVADPTAVDATQGRVTDYLQTRSDAAALAPAGYDVVVQTNADVRDQAQQMTDTFTRYLLAVGAISLLVGAIGIANVMLVSVAERTREIGILRAVGARRRDVVQLFLVETLAVGSVGSLLGAGTGVVGARLATHALDLPFAVQPAWLVSAVVVGLLVAVLGGLYPAWRAARVDPIAALRWE